MVQPGRLDVELAVQHIALGAGLDLVAYQPEHLTGDPIAGADLMAETYTGQPRRARQGQAYPAHRVGEVQHQRVRRYLLDYVCNIERQTDAAQAMAQASWAAVFPQHMLNAILARDLPIFFPCRKPI